MFITENQNITDSILFLLASRTALSNIIESSVLENKDELSDFIRNEASDYQVMNLLLNGSLPDEKYNNVAEMLLFSDLKESLLYNKQLISEMVGEEIFYNVLNEVDSLYMTTSTAAPILEFEVNNYPEVAAAYMLYSLTEGPNMDAAKGMLKTSKDWWTKLAKDYKAGKITKAKYKALSTSRAAQASKAAASKAKAAAVDVGRMKGGLGSPVPRAASSKAAGYAKGAAAKAKADAITVGRMKGGAGAPSSLSKAKGIIGKKAAAAKQALAPHVATAKSNLAKGYGHAKVAATKGAAATKAAATKAAAAVKGAASKGASKGVAVAKTPAGKAVGGAAVAAVAIYGGYQIYKRFFSQAAKVCSGKSGAEKTQCMSTHRKSAIAKQISAIQSAANACAKSKDPVKCKVAIRKKVTALKARAAKI